MFMFLGILSLLLFLVMLVVSINPKWISRGEKKYTRKQVLLSAGVMFVLFCIFAINDDSNNSAATLPPSTSAVTAPAKTPEQIAQEKADTDLKAKQAEEAKVAAAAKVKADADAKVAADKAAAVAKIASLKSEAKTIPYKDLARTPDTYMGAKVKYTGKVIQVQEDGSAVGLRVNVTKGEYGLYDNTMFVAYDKGVISGRVLEDDIVSLWGTSTGLLTYKTVMGAELSIPQVLAQIVEVN